MSFDQEAPNGDVAARGATGAHFGRIAFGGANPNYHRCFVVQHEFDDKFGECPVLGMPDASQHRGGGGYPAASIVLGDKRG